MGLVLFPAEICHCRYTYNFSLHGRCLNTKITSYQYRDSHYKDKAISRPSYLYNGNPHTWKTVFILRRVPVSLCGEDSGPFGWSLGPPWRSQFVNLIDSLEPWGNYLIGSPHWMRRGCALDNLKVSMCFPYIILFMCHTCLLLFISMLWHRQAIFESKGDKLASSVECRIRTQRVSGTESPADYTCVRVSYHIDYKNTTEVPKVNWQKQWAKIETLRQALYMLHRLRTAFIYKTYQVVLLRIK